MIDPMEGEDRKRQTDHCHLRHHDRDGGRPMIATAVLAVNHRPAADSHKTHAVDPCHRRGVRPLTLELPAGAEANRRPSRWPFFRRAAPLDWTTRNDGRLILIVVDLDDTAYHHPS
jgi:hypothetical protein